MEYGKAKAEEDMQMEMESVHPHGAKEVPILSTGQVQPFQGTSQSVRQRTFVHIMVYIPNF